MNRFQNWGSARELDRAFAFLIGCLPFCVAIRLPPHPGFWGQWLGIALALVWLAARPARLHAIPRGALPFLAIASLLLVQLLAGMVKMPMSAVVAVFVLLIAALTCEAPSSTDAAAVGDRWTSPFAWGLITALLLNGVAVVFGWAGYEFHYYWIYETPPPARALGLIGQSNHLAVLAVFASFAALHLYMRGALSRIALWTLAAIASVVCAAAASRVALGIWLASALLTHFWLRRAEPCAGGQSGMRARHFGALVVLFLVIQGAWQLRNGASSGTVGGSLTRSGAGRVEMLRDAVALWQQHPWLGVGEGNYAAARLHDLAGPLPAPHSDNAHNLFAHALAVWGVVGFGIVAAATVWLLLIVWRRFRAADRGTDELFPAIWVLGVLLHSLVEHPLWFVHFLLPFALMAGTLPQPALVVRRKDPNANAATRVALVTLALAVSLVAAADYARIQRIALGILVETDLPPGSPALVRLADTARVDRLTMFPLFARLQLTRKLPLGGEAAQQKLLLVRQAMDAIPNPETIARYAAFAIVADQQAEAERTLDSLAARNAEQYETVAQLLQAWAESEPRVAAFVHGRPR